MLHRVDERDDNRLFPNENMKVSPEALDSFLQWAQKSFSFIRCDQVPEYVASGKEKPFMAFSLDDGYKDNFTKALPVFKKRGVPFTVFFATDFAERDAVLWWYELEDLLLRHETIELSDGSEYSCETMPEKCDVFMQIREKILALGQADFVTKLNELFSRYDVDWTKQCESLCMSWEDIEKLKDEPLADIGAHTKRHCNLRMLATEAQVRQEIAAGMELLRRKAGVESDVLAYPFGTANEAGRREFSIAREMGFRCAYAAGGGAVNRWNGRFAFSLPRIMLTEEYIGRCLGTNNLQW